MRDHRRRGGHPCPGGLRDSGRLRGRLRRPGREPPQSILFLRQDEASMSRTSRRQFLKQMGVAGGAMTSIGGAMLSARRASADGAPSNNVLFISIDDLNDFPAPFGGYSGILTPNMDK